MNKNTYIKWILFVLLSLIWGSSFILMKEGLKGLNAYQVASLRILSAGITLLPFLGKAIKGIPKNMLIPIVLSGFLGTFFPAFLFCIAETKIDSSLAGVLNSLTPICTIAIGTAFFKLKIDKEHFEYSTKELNNYLDLIQKGNQYYIDFALYLKKYNQYLLFYMYQSF
jgi:drug/metabolite transporter (DMT)-like permease